MRIVDDEYNGWFASNAEISQEYESIINGLSHDDKEIAEKYNDNTCRINGRERECAYLQGYKDCIKLLRLLYRK